MVIVFAAQAAVTPDGKPVAVPIPVAPVVVCVTGVSAVLIHNVGVDDAALTVLAAVTVIVPVAFTVPQPPVNGMLYVNTPDAVGVPLIVIVFDAQAAVTPDGNPVAVPIPVAPVVVCVIGVSAVLIHSVGVEEAAPTVLAGCNRDRTCCIDRSATSRKRYAVIKYTAAVGVPLMVIVFVAQAAVYSCW